MIAEEVSLRANIEAFLLKIRPSVSQMTEVAKRLSWYVTMTNPKIPAAAALTHRRMVAGRTQGCSGPLGSSRSSDGMIELRTGRPRFSQRCRPDSDAGCIGAFVPKVFN